MVLLPLEIYIIREQIMIDILILYVSAQHHLLLLYLDCENRISAGYIELSSKDYNCVMVEC